MVYALYKRPLTKLIRSVKIAHEREFSLGDHIVNYFWLHSEV